MSIISRQTRAGFTLVELMVVVAIIGIISAIAVPSFSKFQAKSRQAAAKIELSGLFTSEKAFQLEYDSYSSDMGHVGFVPEGCFNWYAPGMSNGGGIGSCSGNRSRYYSAGFALLHHAPAVALSEKTLVTHYPATILLDNPGIGLSTTTQTSTTSSDFKAAAQGYADGKNYTDIWTIDQDKNLAPK